VGEAVVNGRSSPEQESISPSEAVENETQRDFDVRRRIFILISAISFSQPFHNGGFTAADAAASAAAAVSTAVADAAECEFFAEKQHAIPRACMRRIDGCRTPWG
jgi:hypothetical protein